VSRHRGRLEGERVRFRPIRIAIAVAVVAVLPFGIGDASATMLEVEYTGPGVHEVVKVSYLGHEMNLRTGINDLLVDDVPFESFCVDLDHPVSKSPWTATVEPVSTINGGEQAAWLWKNHAPGLDSEGAAAALQLALWEVVSDWGGGLDLTDGNFRVLGSRGVVSEASLYLSSIPDLIGYVTGVSVLHSEDSQDFLVPEPAAILMFLLTAGALSLRRRL
jgi:hypothetical protein